MKVEFAKIPGKGLCIVISNFRLEDMYGISKEVESISIQHNSPFNNIDRIAIEIRAGRKIAAIKEIRAQTGWGLKESKDYIDKLLPYTPGLNRTFQDYEDAANVFIRKNTFVEFLSEKEMKV